MISSGSRGPPGPKRVMLVDDHTVVRRGLRLLIESMSGCQVCAEASDGHEALIVAAEVRPDIIVMDLSIPKVDGIDATMRLRKTLQIGRETWRERVWSDRVDLVDRRMLKK